MQSQSRNQKTLALRETIRRQYIQSYQKKIRKKYQQNSGLILNKNICISQNFDDNRMIDENNDNIVRTSTEAHFLSILTDMLNLKHSDLCTTQNFEFLLESIYRNNSNNFGQSQNQHRTLQNGNPIINRWAFKEKINSLVYRIVDRVLTGSQYESLLQPFNKIRTISDKMLLLLDFPEIMPLWQKVSLINDLKLKQFFSGRFIGIILKDNKHHIFDPDFVLDVISNFIVKTPQISFQKSLEMLKYVSYEITNREQKSYNWINRICMILRSILKDNGNFKMVSMIENGYEHLFLILMSMLSFENKKHERHKQIQSETFQCYEHDKNQLFSSTVIFKISLVKLINRIFIANGQISQYLYSKSSNFLVPSLLNQLMAAKCQQKSKYQYILCKSHEILCRNILIALATILMAKKIYNLQNLTRISSIKDFIVNNGLQILKKLIYGQNFAYIYTKQLINLVGALEVQELYWNISPAGFHDMLDFLLDFLLSFRNRKKDQADSFEHSYWMNLGKLLKIIKSTILAAYSRATMPTIFEELILKIEYNPEIIGFLNQISQEIPNSLIELDLQKICIRQRTVSNQRFSLLPDENQLNNCCRLSKQIIKICMNVKQFFQDITLSHPNT